MQNNLDQLNEIISSSKVDLAKEEEGLDIKLENILDECEDQDFWRNFKKAAPMLMCASVEYTQDLKSIRDLSFIEELLKTKAILKLMSDKLKSSEADVDLIEYSMATKVLENKLQILESLNVTVEGDSEKQLTLNIQGSDKAIQLDLEKLKDCITVEEIPIPKKEVKPLTEAALNNIDTNLKEDEFLEETVKAIGEIKKTPKKLLEKETFVRVFKYVGDFAKYRSKSHK